jgi:hypothetical protein
MITKNKYLALKKKFSKYVSVDQANKIKIPESVPKVSEFKDPRNIPKQNYSETTLVNPKEQTIRTGSGGGYSPEQYQGKPDTVQWFGAFEGVQLKILTEIKDILIEIRDGKKKKEPKVIQPEYMNNVKENDGI